jgi:hypothetical protein
MQAAWPPTLDGLDVHNNLAAQGYMRPKAMWAGLREAQGNSHARPAQRTRSRSRGRVLGTRLRQPCGIEVQ